MVVILSTRVFLSVVDFCFVSHDNLFMFGEFSVVRTVDSGNLCNDNIVLAPTSTPYHSLIT